MSFCKIGIKLIPTPSATFKSEFFRMSSCPAKVLPAASALPPLHRAGSQVLPERGAHIQHRLSCSREHFRADVGEGKQHTLTAQNGLIAESRYTGQRIGQVV